MLLALALVSALRTATVTDSVPGTWQLTGDIAGSPIKTTCTMWQTGTSLSGNCTNETGAPYVLTGEAKDGKITFQYEVDYQGQTLTIVYSATLSAPRQLKGTVEVKPLGVQGTFAALPVPSKP